VISGAGLLEFEEEGRIFDMATCVVLINRWLKAAAALVGAEAGLVVISDHQASRVISRHNLPHAFMTSVVTVRNPAYPRDARLVVRDALDSPELHALLGPLALERTGFYYRRPLRIEDDCVFALVLFGREPQPQLSQRELDLADEIAEEMAKELARYYPFGTSNISGCMNMALSDIERWLEMSDQPAAMLDSGLIVRTVNAEMRRLLHFDWDGAIGKPMATLNLPASSSIAFLFRHAIETSFSTPRMDIAFEKVNGAEAGFMARLVGSPIRAVDGEIVLIATVDPARVTKLTPRAVAGLETQKGEATADFLLETLVQRRAMRSRHDVCYVTLRSWRQSIRNYQISALKALKKHAPQSLAGAIAGEIGDDVKSLFGVASFRAVVPMPCGHSGGESCLSVAIAQALGRDLGLPVAHALALPPMKGSSHPKANVKRPGMLLMTPVEGPVLLVDDVATSGSHMEEAITLLRGQGASVLAISWIGGDTE
jgi:predicted amidophosphoribosyltransferase